MFPWLTMASNSKQTHLSNFKLIEFLPKSTLKLTPPLPTPHTGKYFHLVALTVKQTGQFSQPLPLSHIPSKMIISGDTGGHQAVPARANNRRVHSAAPLSPHRPEHSAGPKASSTSCHGSGPLCVTLRHTHTHTPDTLQLHSRREQQ